MKVKKGQKIGKWILTSLLGKGGNGEVWRCTADNKKYRAIKLLMQTNQKRYLRFKDEIFIIEKKSKLEGILHPIDKHLPDTISTSLPYYVMPIAKPCLDKLIGKSIEEKIEAIIDVAKTLMELHKEKISHRDIKPANILYLNKHYILSDFGLVDYPNKKDVSSTKEEIGAKWTIAPEMRRNAYKSDGLKADVYSIAKTLWILLTENLTGFDGQYSINSIIELKKTYRDTYTALLDELLQKSTDNDPQNRPSIENFMKYLENWKILNNSFHLRNQRQWFEIQTQLFPASIPQRVIWESKSDIIKILKIVGSIPSLNHMFFPNGGGMDLEDCRESVEEGCIELDCGYTEIVKPKRLIFESFNYDHEWNYLRLELNDLEPSGVYENNEDSVYESVSEISSGQYEDYSIVEYFSDYKEEYNLTEKSRLVTRWFKGSFVIFCKRSTYNSISATYDGRHNKFTSDEFRSYIGRSIHAIKERNENLSIIEKQKIAVEKELLSS